MIRSLPLTVLSLMLGFFFVFVGLIKVTPRVNEQIHADMVSATATTIKISILMFIGLMYHYIYLIKKQEFGRYNKVFPLYKFTGWRPLAKNFRTAVGTVEILSGASFILIPGLYFYNLDLDLKISVYIF